VLPIFAYYVMSYFNIGLYFWIFFYLGYLPSLYLWQSKIDKKLVFTPRVKRFFLFLALGVLFADTLCMLSVKCIHLGVFIPLFIAFIASYIYEKMNFLGFKKEATKKLESMDNLKIIAITASYGKTSMKNFLYQILSTKYNCYKTPRSVNTLGGLIKDVNDDMPNDIEYYIAEAGARERGDIREIAEFLNHDYGIVGSIGPSHIEYFKTVENIRDTKMEIRASKKLKKLFVHTSANVKKESFIKIFGDDIKDVKATLEGVSFSLMIDDKLEEFKTPLLGAFNAINLTACIYMAYEIGMSLDEIKKALLDLDQVEHRLQKIEAGGKLIIDDSFNGNFEGMSSSYDLVSLYSGRKVIITPGIIESDDMSNIELAKKIDKVFDIVIITGTLNAQILYENIKSAKKILLKDKSKLEDILAKETKVGDLILFSNDAPTFI
jgi:UDP-N-acetylmuramoyl-tripeptide--D-alanyl-D-alanine ligase